MIEAGAAAISAGAKGGAVTPARIVFRDAYVVAFEPTLGYLDSYTRDGVAVRVYDCSKASGSGYVRCVGRMSWVSRIISRLPRPAP